MNIRNCFLAATMLAAPLALAATAKAQPVSGPYIAGGLGYSLEASPKAKNFTANGAGVGDEARIVMDNGYTGEVSLGYGFGNGWRTEIEGDYIHNGANKIKLGGTNYSASGDEARYGVFGNVLYDFDIGLPYLYPYVGAGVGWQEDYFHNYSVSGVATNKARGSLAYQGIAGLAMPIAAVPGLSATLEYRYVALAQARKFNTGFAGVPVSGKLEPEHSNQILVGLRYQLFTPPAVPPAPAPMAQPAAAPAPVSGKTYLVFFDWDKASLTPRANQIIAQAAADSKTQTTTTINVAGYTDTSGTADYNMGLSQRRAQAVSAQLITDGVPKNEIEIHAYGETHLLVPTGPGVREPQNRRVEIVLTP